MSLPLLLSAVFAENTMKVAKLSSRKLILPEISQSKGVKRYLWIETGESDKLKNGSVVHRQSRREPP
jgi:hypothetical protein